MGASKEHHFTAVTHRWRARARTAERRLDLVEQRVATLAERIERDRREPDKVLLYVADLQRLAVDIEEGRDPR